MRSTNTHPTTPNNGGFGPHPHHRRTTMKLRDFIGDLIGALCLFGSAYLILCIGWALQ